MKLHWGHKITIAMVLFIGFITYMVIALSSTKVDLYSEDYYQQELDYEQHILAVENSVGLDQQISVSLQKDIVVITVNPALTDAMIGGKVYFYKSNNSSADKLIELKLSNSQMLIPSTNFEQGYYSVKIYWTNNDKDYYVEKTLNIN